MKKFLLGTVALVTLGMAAPASAADLAARPYTKAPPPMVAAMYDWSGFYIGANGGWAWGRRCLDFNDGFTAFDEGCRDANGGVVGGQIGYRWQASSFVFGLEAQGDWANLRNSNDSLAFPGATFRSRTNALGLFTGQVGYAWNNVLWYVKGGAAVTNQRWDLFDTATGVGFAQAERTRWGGTVGTGIEYAFAPNWSFAIEYDYIFRTSDTDRFVIAGPATIDAHTRQDVNMITGRINYKFGWGGPVVAKY
jgi:outer membrane immunogenic protein